VSDTTYVGKHRTRSYAETIAERLDLERVEGRTFREVMDEEWRPDPDARGTGVQTFDMIAEVVHASGATLAMGRGGRCVLVFADGLHLSLHSPQVLSDAQALRFDADARRDNAVAASTLAAVGAEPRPRVKSARTGAGEAVSVFSTPPSPSENRSIPAVERIEDDARADAFRAEQHTKTVEGWD
jgi:hypothetical protein